MSTITDSELALAKLCRFEQSDQGYGEERIGRITSSIRAKFAAEHVRVDQEIDARIKAAAIRANCVAAEFELNRLESWNVVYGVETVKRSVAKIRAQFAAGGVHVDKKLDARIEAAAVHANRTNAESELRRFETAKARYSKRTIRDIEKGIRAQFKAGKIRVTAQGKLPKRREARLSAAMARAKRTSVSATHG
jgi:hypothetical protein